MKIGFRVDASYSMGSGHVMRCLALADALRRRGAHCVFVCREYAGDLVGLIGQRGYDVHTLCAGDGADVSNTKPGSEITADWETDANETVAHLGEHALDWLVIDHYGLDARWERSARRSARRILVIDDLADRDHDCDFLLDQNVVAEMETRYRERIPDRCVALIGPRYALLHADFAELHERAPPREGPVLRVFAFFGGGDTAGLTAMTVEAFSRIGSRDATLEVVALPGVVGYERIAKAAHDDPRIVVHGRLPSLATAMLRADLAIGASGTTTWERCCLGLPSVVVTMAANQEPIAAELNRRGIVRWIGDVSTMTVNDLQNAIEATVEEGLDAGWSDRCKELVDGRGADIVAALMTVEPGARLNTRHARLADEGLYLEWANDPMTRHNAFSPNRIPSAAHREWFRERLRRPETVKMFIVETTDRLPLGQVRFERDDDEWEIHYSLDRRVRGRGLGLRLLEVAIETLRQDVRGPMRLKAKVKDSNLASSRIFESLSFMEFRNTGQIREFRRADS